LPGLLGFSECFHNQLPAFDLQTVPVSGILDLDHVGGRNAPGSQGGPLQQFSGRKIITVGKQDQDTLF
jgi:hypothetical protein